MAMTKPRVGYHNLFTQIPDELWERLCRDADDMEGGSVARVITRILAKHYRVSPDELPKPKRAGRPKKK